MKAFIIFRDRVSYLDQCMLPLLRAGLDVRVVDHNSTWPGAVERLHDLMQDGFKVMWRGENAYPWELWEWEPWRRLMNDDPEPYVVTDPDVWPSDDCPADWLERLKAVLAAHPEAVKVGLGLRLDRLPQDQLASESVGHEHMFWTRKAGPGLYHANVDTTLAIYKPFHEYPVFSFGPALRTGFPYVADHWGYMEREPLSGELAYYKAHADPGHHAVRTVRGRPGLLVVKHAPMGSRHE